MWWVEQWLPKRYIHLGTYNVNLFGKKRIFADTIKDLMMRSSSIRVGNKSSDTVHKETKKKKDTETQRKRPCEDRGRDKMEP